MQPPSKFELAGKAGTYLGYFDEEREKVRVLKEVLCRWSAHLSEQDKLCYVPPESSSILWCRACPPNP